MLNWSRSLKILASNPGRYAQAIWWDGRVEIMGWSGLYGGMTRLICMESQMWPPSHDLYIPFFQSWPSQDAIMTGQLKNHDRPMFAIIAGSTYNIVIPCYQSLPGQLITWPSHVYNRSRSRCHPMLCYNHGQVKIQPDSAMISILTPQWFQSWLRKDFNPDSARIFNPDLARILILTLSSVDKITLAKIFGDPDYLTTRTPCAQHAAGVRTSTVTH